MTVLHLYFLYLLFIRPAIGEAAGNVMDLIPPEAIELLCPSKNICRRNNSSAPARLDVPEKYRQCCRDCSCSEECGDNETCCFPWMNKQVKTRRTNQNTKCIEAVIVGSTMYDLLPSAYYMAIGQSVLGKHSSSSHSDHCSESTVAVWGSLFPVTSRITGQTYINSHCAEADGIGVMEYVQWEPYMTCWVYQLHREKIQFSQLLSKSGDPSPGCIIQFSPPADIKDRISADECFIDLIEGCHSERIPLPDSLNMTIIDVRAACESGLHSPFVFRYSIYVNVFCFLCNPRWRFDVRRMDCAGEYLDSFLQPGKNDSTWVVPGKSMSILLNTDLHVSAQETIVEDRLSKPLVCESNNPSACKEKLCPSGQEYDRNGKCQFTSSVWSRILLMMHVSLTPTKPMNASLLQAVSVSAPIKSWLRSPWSNNWKIRFSFLRDVDVLEPGSDQLILLMIYVKPGAINPKQLMSSVKKSISKDFQICVENECIKFKQKFATYTEFDSTHDGKLMPKWLHIWKRNGFPDNITAPDTGNLSFKLIHVVRPNFLVQEGRFNIRKMEICPQIELNPDEYELYADNCVLFYERQKLLLFDNEFELVQASVGKPYARVCVDQTRFIDKHRRSNSPQTVSSIPVIILALILTRWFPFACMDTSFAYLKEDYQNMNRWYGLIRDVHV